MIYIIESVWENEGEAGWYSYCQDQHTGKDILTAYHPTSRLIAFSNLLDMMKEELV